MKRIII